MFVTNIFKAFQRRRFVNVKFVYGKQWRSQGHINVEAFRSTERREGFILVG